MHNLKYFKDGSVLMRGRVVDGIHKGSDRQEPSFLGLLIPEELIEYFPRYITTMNSLRNVIVPLEVENLTKILS